MRLWARWIGVAALVLWASCVQAQVDEPEAAGQTGQQDRPADTLPLPFPVEIVEDQAEAEARQAAQERAEQREIGDLAAQEGMNEATRRMADLAEYQTWLIGIGTTLVAGTLYLMIGANRAAVAAVEVTRDIGQRQLRAYVLREKTRIYFENGRIGCEIFVKNFGVTPASDVKAAIGMGIMNFPLDSDIPKPRFSDTPSVTILGPNHQTFYTKLPHQGIVVTKGDVENVYTGISAIYVYGIIKYVDIFDNCHTTRFNMFYRGELKPGGEHSASGYRAGNEAD